MDARILVVEDEEHLARGLVFNLEAEGYEVESLERGEPALDRLGEEPSPDLLLLDVMLPGISGFEVLEKLRSDENQIPVLLLTARDAEEDVVHGLDIGADDYLTKPFSLPVLLARVRTLIRRTSGRGDDPAESEAPFTIGETTIYPDRFELERDGERQNLTAKELALVSLLWARRGTAVSRGDILQDVWGLHRETRTRVVDTFVLRLRKLLEPDPSEPRFLLAVRSFGYKLVSEPDGDA